MNETYYQIAHSCNADQTRLIRLYNRPDAPMFYPSGYFVRRDTLIRQTEAGIPELVTDAR